MPIKYIYNSKYQRMLQPLCLQDHVDYLELINSFFFSVITDLKSCNYEDKFQEEMSTFVKMMFSKAKVFRNLLNGIIHYDEEGQSYLVIDHTILFTIVRSAYEQLCAFELVYVLPDTNDKRIILRNAYIASGLSNQKKMLTKEELVKYEDTLEEKQIIIDECYKQIIGTTLYQSLDKHAQEKLYKEVFENGHFQLYFNNANKLDIHVGWDKVRDLFNINADAFKGLYNYACNMAHPSYLALNQYMAASNIDDLLQLAETATRQLSSIMSIFIMDYMTKFPMVKLLYKKLDKESQYMICWYNNVLRNDGNR